MATRISLDTRFQVHRITEKAIGCGEPGDQDKKVLHWFPISQIENIEVGDGVFQPEELQEGDVIDKMDVADWLLAQRGLLPDKF